MEMLDPRLGLLAAGGAMIGSERVRRAVGRGAGHVAAGAMAVGGSIVRPMAKAGQDIVDEARDAAGHGGSAATRRSRSKSAAR